MKECVDTCALKFFEDTQTASGDSYRKCVLYDATRYFVRESIATGSGFEEYTHYYGACPEGHQFHDQSGFECKENCGGLPYIPGTNENICVESCSGAGFPYTEDGVCVMACKSGHF